MQPTTRTRLAWFAGALTLLALGAGCLGTPLPDPPSFRGEAVTLSASPQPGSVRLVGDPGAATPTARALRITIPPSAGVLVAIGTDGSFGRIVPGAPGDRIFVELVFPGEDRFVGAFTAGLDERLVPADPGPDTDTDTSPDAIDCAPADASVGGQRCVVAAACATDAECAAGQVCMTGVCRVTCTTGLDCAAGESCTGRVCTPLATCTDPLPETCDGTDEDCNGTIDEGEPGAGVPCVTSASCPGIAQCVAPPLTCEPTRVPEVCGNGLDDDCDGAIDDGC